MPIRTITSGKSSMAGYTVFSPVEYHARHISTNQEVVMRDAVLLELAAKWEREAVPPDCEDGSDHAKVGNALAHGLRKGKLECAIALKTLVSLLGGE